MKTFSNKVTFHLNLNIFLLFFFLNIYYVICMNLYIYFIHKICSNLVFTIQTFLISKYPTPMCNKFQEDLTIQHIFQDYPNLQNIQNILSISDRLDEALN
jgi:hypothetical protein